MNPLCAIIKLLRKEYMKRKAARKPYRIEKDSMGEVRVPANALWGAQTQRAVENFPVSGRPMPQRIIHTLGLVKAAAARANRRLGLLDARRASAMERAAREVAEGKWDDQFPIDIFQTGSGTSTNMNANEVIARRAETLAGRGVRIHPNDHANRGQSSNDVFPTVLHIAAYLEVKEALLPSLKGLASTLRRKAREFDGIVKAGRTHTQDATPVRMGQEFSGWATQIENGIERIQGALPRLAELALGGTAVGTGINTHPRFARTAIAILKKETGLPLREAPDHFEAQGSRDALVELSAAVKVLAVSLFKIASDVRFLSSGPETGIGELLLPDLQPGSSIMPGKVNPVIPEVVAQVSAQVIGNDTAVGVAGLSGHLELNTMMPVIGRNVLESIALLGAACRLFDEKCVRGMKADRKRCRRNAELSPSVATALNPLIGYDRAAALVKEARATGKTIRQLLKEKRWLSEGKISEILNLKRMTGR
jgi:fumarate hydratase class II